MSVEIAKRIIIGGIIMVGALVLLMLYLPGGPNGRPEPESAGRAAIGGPFTLVNQNGETVTEDDLRGGYSLIFFGFTHCPDICPMTLQKITDALNELPADRSNRITPVLITVDPARDTPEAMKEYVGYFHPNTLGLTGSAEQVAQAADSYRVYYNRVDLDGGEYTMDHSGFTYIMGPRGQYIDHFNADAEVEDIVAKLNKAMT